MLASESALILAERCLAHAEGAGFDAAPASVGLARAHALLASALGPVIGDAGFAALFARGVRKAQRNHHELQTINTAPPASVTLQLWALLSKHDPSAVRAVSATVLAEVFELMSVLIGESLTTRLTNHALRDEAAVPASASRRNDDE